MNVRVSREHGLFNISPDNYTLISFFKNHTFSWLHSWHWKFLSQGSNTCHSSNLSHCSRILNPLNHGRNFSNHILSIMYFKIKLEGVPTVVQGLKICHCPYGSASSIPSLAQWVKDPTLLQLWHSLQLWL